MHGYKHVIIPRHVIIDRRLVLLLSFLSVYNLETLSDYLHHCSRIVNGCCTDEAYYDKLFIQVPVRISHLMKSARADVNTIL